MNITEAEALQAVSARLEAGLKPGDKIIIEKVGGDLRVYSEFKEVCSENIRAAVSHK